MKSTIYYLSAILIIFLTLDWLYPLDRERLNKPLSLKLYDRDDRLIGIRLSEDGYIRFRVNHIDDNIKKLLLAYEDRLFYWHFGINPFSLVRAIWFNINNKRVIGASTITMQVARIMKHKPRTIKNKIIEMFVALQLEWHFSKDEILEFYLNNTPYGGNIEGVATASYLYFQRDIEALSMAELAYLISIPKNPNRNRAKDVDRANMLSRKVINRAYRSNLISKDVKDRAVEEWIEPKREPLPNITPHILAMVQDKIEVKSTIDSHLQERVEKIIQNRVNNLNVDNGMAIVIDNKTMEILAYLPSQNFNDYAHSGQVNGLKALIGAGSTLKPLIYARAFDRGFISPNSILYDVPISISGYRPMNYNRRFMGLVTTTEALQLSLNIPAISLDILLKDDSLYYLLKLAKVGRLNRNKNYYGSSLVLGGFGITLKEITELFSSLANGGIFRKSHYIKGEINEGIRLFSPASAYLVGEILSNAPRDSFSSVWEFIKDMPKIAFKTGTTARARDLLSIGYTPEYTVGVWFGNFDGTIRKESEGLTGLNSAFKPLLDIFKVLKPKSRWFDRAEEIKREEICEDTLKSECTHKIKDSVIVTPKIPCQIVKQFVTPPPMSRRCKDSWLRYRPKIISPQDREIRLNPLLPKELNRIKLQCNSLQEDKSIIFLIDRERIDGISDRAIFMNLDRGRHNLSCIDRGGNLSSFSFWIK